MTTGEDYPPLVYTYSMLTLYVSSCDYSYTMHGKTATLAGVTCDCAP